MEPERPVARRPVRLHPLPAVPTRWVAVDARRWPRALLAEPRTGREAELPDERRALLAEPRADEKVAPQRVAGREAELPDERRALLAEPRAGEEIALPQAEDRSERLRAVPWAGREAELPDELRVLPAVPRADEEVAPQRPADHSEEPSARVGGRPLVFLRSPSSPHVPPPRPKFLQRASQSPTCRRVPRTFARC